jgi:hypothetical protein
MRNQFSHRLLASCLAGLTVGTMVFWSARRFLEIKCRSRPGAEREHLLLINVAALAEQQTTASPQMRDGQARVPGERPGTCAFLPEGSSLADRAPTLQIPSWTRAAPQRLKWIKRTGVDALRMSLPVTFTPNQLSQ